MELLDDFNTRINRIVCGFLTVIFSIMVVVIFHPGHLPLFARASAIVVGRDCALPVHLGDVPRGQRRFHENTHINVTYFTDHIANVRARALIMLVADLASMTFLGMYVSRAFPSAVACLLSASFSPAMEWLPIGLVYLAIPVGSLLMLLNILAYALRHLHALRTGETTQQPPAHH